MRCDKVRLNHHLASLAALVVSGLLRARAGSSVWNERQRWARMELRLRPVTSAGQSQSGDRYVGATFPLVSQGCAGSNWYNGKGSSQRLKMESCVARREISAVRSCRQAIRL